MFFLLAIAIIASYCVGAIPTGYLIGRYFFRVDLTQHGSGNIGATNAARVIGGIRYFFIVFLLDASKAWLSLFFLEQLLHVYVNSIQISNVLLVCSAVLLLGNTHSVFLGFKGGKGVATSLGLIAYLIPFNLLLIFLCTWLLLLAVTRLVFIASIGATASLVASYGLLYYSSNDLLMYFLIMLLYWIILRHKSNIVDFFYHRLRY